jgi:Short C-terminal domain
MNYYLAKAEQKVSADSFKSALSKLQGAYETIPVDEWPDLLRVRELADQIAEHTEGRVMEKARTLATKAAERAASYEDYSKRIEDGKPELQAVWQGSIAVVQSCRFLGGHGFPLHAGDVCALVFADKELRVAVSTREPSIVPYEEITEIEIGGPGRTQTGGGFFGGGFGLSGAAEGMLIANALNLLTTRTNVDTVICVQTREAEVFFHHNQTPPDALRIQLSPVFSALRRLQSIGSELEPPARIAATVVDHLARLAELHAAGSLTDDEFAAAKARLLE